MARRQLEVSNEVAAELAGSRDAALRTLEEHLDCEVFLRGNIVTLDGEAEAVQAGRDGDPRAVGAGRARARHRAGDDRVGRARARVLGVALEGARGRRVAPPQPARRAEVGQPEALRGRDPPLDGDVRRRPGGHRQDVPGDGDGHRGAVAARGQPHHPHAPGGRGRRAARLPAGRPDGQGGPVPAAAVRRAQRHDGPRARGHAPGEGRDRGRAAGVHARADAQRLVRDPRRGAEHHARADEDVPDPARVRLAGWSSRATSRRSTCRATRSPA